MSEYNSESGTIAVVPSNKKLSESKLKLPTMQTLPIEVETVVSLVEAIQGSKRSFEVSDLIACDDCINLKPISRMQCPICKGIGYMQVTRAVEVHLPDGLLQGQKIPYFGRGRFDYRSGKYSDLIVKIKISECEDLTVLGKDILCAT